MAYRVYYPRGNRLCACYGEVVHFQILALMYELSEMWGCWIDFCDPDSIMFAIFVLSEYINDAVLSETYFAFAQNESSADPVFARLRTLFADPVFARHHREKHQKAIRPRRRWWQIK